MNSMIKRGCAALWLFALTAIAAMAADSVPKFNGQEMSLYKSGIYVLRGITLTNGTTYSVGDYGPDSSREGQMLMPNWVYSRDFFEVVGEETQESSATVGPITFSSSTESPDEDKYFNTFFKRTGYKFTALTGTYDLYANFNDNSFRVVPTDSQWQLMLTGAELGWPTAYDANTNWSLDADKLVYAAPIEQDGNKVKFQVTLDIAMQLSSKTDFNMIYGNTAWDNKLTPPIRVAPATT